MSKIIIDNRSSLSDGCAAIRVAAVIDDGRISDGGKGYCYVTTFRKSALGAGVAVLARRNKSSDTFVVLDIEEQA
jgi:hypothetical protein